MYKLSIIAAFILLSSCVPEDSLLHGYVEAEYQYISPINSGILSDIYVKRGDYAEAGTILFSLEDEEIKIAIERAKAEVRRVEAISDENYKDYLRTKELLKSNASSQSSLEQKESSYNSSKAALDVAKQDLLNEEKKLKDSTPYSTNNAYIEDIFFTSGEFVPAGQPVLSLLSPEDIKIRFFLSQEKLPQIKEGQDITISCDGCKEKILAKITYISKQAEYTPPMIYSTDSRKKMVFMIEAKPHKYEEFLHPGLPVDIDVKRQNDE